ncbi:LRR domain containing protein [Parasponia andersonii]|uniref:LRR domain containing protein n=1 Tax=Parasponia andersonii TaxID=3476 RepID=A0A2P5CS64_PARAD|nr:LRR domain containing protein [Parasponia andersonii]
MATLQKLPNLRTLHLDRDAFLGFEMVCSRGGFPRLESLSLVELFYLEEWQVEEGALPSLCRLNIRCCKRLMTLPDGLKHVITVKEIMVERMPIEFKYRVGEGGVDFYKVKHVPSLLLPHLFLDLMDVNKLLCRGVLTMEIVQVNHTHSTLGGVA